MINIVLAFFGRVMQAGVWHSLDPFVFRCLKVRMWFLCASSTAESQMPYYKAKRKRSARGKCKK